MRYVFSLGGASFLLASFCVMWQVFATDNTELISPGGTVEKQATYSYRTFASCEEMESVTASMLSGMTDAVSRWGAWYEKAAVDAVAPQALGTSTASAGHSQTNIQVSGIDEADTVKTDGKYIYSYQEGERAVVILDANTLKSVQNIRVPESYYDVKIYVQDNTLILTAARSITYNARWYGWYDNTQRGIVAIYDMTDRSRVSLERVIQLDGTISDSRLDSDGIMTLIGTNYLGVPPIYYSADARLATPYTYAARSLIPNIYDSTYSVADGFKTESRRSLDCTEIGAVLPDDLSTLSDSYYSPAVTTVVRFDTKASSGALDSKVIFSSNQQIHLSHDSLYLTTPVYSYGESTCPAGAMCKTIWNPVTSSSTIVHRFAFDGEQTQYVYSHTIAGSPLDQYSMDEDASENLRIVTAVDGQTQSTAVTVLNSLGKVVGTLTNIAPDENFQSARFIGNRLYLVTFEQIDPFFVIDLSNASSPKILGELKIPGYSTYLHPYDADRLIGLGYATEENNFWGTQNAGIKIDLYNVADVTKPVQEQSLVLGGIGSYSEVLDNPRAFVWDTDRDLLLMPTLLMDSDTTGYTKGAFQWVVWVEITPEDITEKFRVTHITYASGAEDAWKKDCEEYLKETDTATCVKLLDGTEYCPGNTRYVPQYCYEGATVESYIADHIWEYSNDYISRALYIGDSFYTIGNSRISKWNFANTATPSATAEFASEWVLQYISSFIR